MLVNTTLVVFFEKTYGGRALHLKKLPAFAVIKTIPSAEKTEWYGEV